MVCVAPANRTVIQPRTFMSAAYHFSIEDEVVVVTIAGIVTGEVVIDMLTELFDDPGRRACPHRIYNALEIEQLLLSPEDWKEMRRLATEGIARLPVKGKSAYVVNGYVTEMAATIMTHVVRERQARLFSSMQQADKWIREP